LGNNTQFSFIHVDYVLQMGLLHSREGVTHTETSFYKLSSTESANKDHRGAHTLVGL